MDVKQILDQATKKRISDIFIIAGLPLSYKIGGYIEESQGERLHPKKTFELITELYKIANRDIDEFERKGDDMFWRESVGRDTWTIASDIQR